MSEFKINDCAEVIATGRIGRIKRIEKTEKTGKLKYFLSFYDKSFINPEITAYRGNEHEPPPAENKTIKENDNTIHTGINKASEKRDIFSPNVIIFAFETRVVVVILFQ